jgi:anti-sigma B factor antagonist/stage II sporulation protein AA (anti-sigma F factor antagonist)
VGPFIGDPHDAFSVRTRHHGRARVISLRGELDLTTVAEVQPAIEEAIRATEDEALVVDLFGVSFLDSQGLYALLVLRERLGERAERLAIACEPGGAVAMVFRVSGTDRMFSLYPDVPAALQALRRLPAP